MRVHPATVQRAQAGDRDACGQLAREVSQPLFLAASRILHDTHAAEDAVQMTLVAIWRDLRSLRDPERFTAWAYRTLVRFCHLEGRRRRRAGVTFEEIGGSSAMAGDDTVGPRAPSDPRRRPGCRAALSAPALR